MRTREAVFTPLALTASITASTFFSRERALALRVTESFHGVFLKTRRECAWLYGAYFK
jgi:hypothetical protein